MNKRYKLLRALPNAKAGEIFKRDNYGDLIFENQDSIASRGVIAFTDGEIKQFDILNPDKGWFEKIKDDGYWYLGTEGTPITRGFALSAKNSTDEAREAIGNYFKTKEEAEKELKRRRAYVILKEDTKGFEPDWTDGSQPKYFVIYNYYDDELDRGMVYRYKADGRGLYFATEKNAQASIEAHRQQWLDYLGIEEVEVVKEDE